MKILISNIWMKQPAGTECWCVAMANELMRRGHQVKLYTPEPGKFFEQAGLNMASPGEEFDFILDNHCVTAGKFEGRTIHTCHGIGEHEKPMTGAVNVAVTDTVANRWHLRYIIPNGVDTDMLKPVMAPDRKLHKVLSLCKTASADEMLGKVCDMLGLELTTTYKNEVFDIGSLINENDMVVGVGRSLLDAMACGRPVISFDDRPYYPTRYLGHGYIRRNDFPYYTVDNFTGASLNRHWDVGSLAEEFRKYDPADGGINREYIVNHLSIANTVNAYLALYIKEFVC